MPWLGSFDICGQILPAAASRGVTTGCWDEPLNAGGEAKPMTGSFPGSESKHRA